jgi:hypothetical protein
VRFVHLGIQRPKAIRPATEEKPVDVLNLISGVADNLKRNIPCQYPGCDALFIRYHDMTKHMEDHWEPMEQANPVDAGLVAGQAAGTAVSVEQETSTPDFDEFWIGGGLDLSLGQDAYGSQQDEWPFDESEMRRLIGNSTEDELTSSLDPDLFVDSYLNADGGQYDI